jgi:hypothetical protein
MILKSKNMKIILVIALLFSFINYNKTLLYFKKDFNISRNIGFPLLLFMWILTIIFLIFG